MATFVKCPHCGETNNFQCAGGYGGSTRVSESVQKQDCSECERPLATSRLPCVGEDNGGVCGSSAAVPTDAFAGDRWYLCSKHMDQLGAVMKKLGRPGDGPGHAPGCDHEGRVGPLVAHADAERQNDHLREIATANGIIFSDDRRSAGTWSSDCCRRPIVVMNIDGKAYALNPQQLNRSGFWMRVER